VVTWSCLDWRSWLGGVQQVVDISGDTEMNRLVVFWVLVLAAVGVCVADITIRASADGNVVEVDYPYKRDAVDEMVDGVVRHYNETVGRLISELKDPNAPFMSHEKIIGALGTLRAVEAVDVLIENINLVSQIRWLALDVRLGPDYPARKALIKIGRPASLMIMDIVANCNKYDEAKVNGYAQVLAEIEGSRYALMKLEERLGKVENPKVWKQHEKVMDRVRKIQARHDR